jgi:hypothetical protein
MDHSKQTPDRDLRKDSAGGKTAKDHMNRGQRNKHLSSLAVKASIGRIIPTSMNAKPCYRELRITSDCPVNRQQSSTHRADVRLNEAEGGE